MTNKNGIDEFLADFERAHDTDAAIQKGLQLILTDAQLFNGELQAIVCEGKITLGAAAAERGKCRISAKNEQGEAAAMDVFNPADATRRDKFIKQIADAIQLTSAEKREVSTELISLAAAADSIFSAAAEDKTKTGQPETVETSFQILSDGRVIEQIRGGLAIFDPETAEYDVVESVIDSDGTTYVPIQDELFTKDGGIGLANALTEYGSEAELIEDIETYLSKNLDLKPLFLKLTALYILFTYIFDAVLELSYLNATGDAGSGKSRFGQTVCIASHRGLSLITPSAASLFRIVDKFHPTLFIDEFNSDANSDDAAAIIQILNAGVQKTAQIPRQVATPDGKFKTEMFDAFCPKIIGSLKQSASNAFNSRCVEIRMERTTRNDIPLRLSHKLLSDAQIIRNKLTLWRLRSIQIDFEARLDQAESELRNAGIMPRLIQINIPLFALIESKDTKREFINLLKGRDEVLAEEKALSLDGEIVDNIHTLLFETDEEEIVENGKTVKKEVAVLNPKNFSALPADDEICEELRVERLLGMMNANRPKEIPAQSFGKMIFGLGLKTKKIVKRSSDHRLKKAIVFDAERLGYLFRIYNLPISEEFNVTNVTKNASLNDNKHLTVVTSNGSGNAKDPLCYQSKPNNINIYEIGNIGNIKNPETPLNGKKQLVDEVM